MRFVVATCVQPNHLAVLYNYDHEPQSSPEFLARITTSSHSLVSPKRLKLLSARSAYSSSLWVLKSSDLTKEELGTFSRTCTVWAFRRTMCERMGLDPERVRVWNYFSGCKFELCSKLSATFDDIMLDEGQQMMLEEQDPDGTYDACTPVVASSTTPTAAVVAGSTTPTAAAPMLVVPAFSIGSGGQPQPRNSSDLSRGGAADIPLEAATWACAVCTFANVDGVGACEMCDTLRGHTQTPRRSPGQAVRLNKTRVSDLNSGAIRPPPPPLAGAAPSCTPLPPSSTLSPPTLSSPPPPPARSQILTECVICMSELVTRVCFVPCGHSSCCPQCAEQLSRGSKCCPMCREQIRGIQRVYL